MTEQDAVRKMLEQGGTKPSATEYTLQQMIFVVPKSGNANIGQRKREADAMRARFNGCENTRQFAKGLIDVTVRDLGRVSGTRIAVGLGRADQEHQDWRGNSRPADRPRP